MTFFNFIQQESNIQFQDNDSYSQEEIKEEEEEELKDNIPDDQSNP